jgi:hypothetical protein
MHSQLNLLRPPHNLPLTTTAHINYVSYPVMMTLYESQLVKLKFSVILLVLAKIMYRIHVVSLVFVLVENEQWKQKCRPITFCHGLLFGS